jgi:hypothetical protein
MIRADSRTNPDGSWPTSPEIFAYACNNWIDKTWCEAAAVWTWTFSFRLLRHNQTWWHWMALSGRQYLPVKKFLSRKAPANVAVQITYPIRLRFITD